MPSNIRGMTLKPTLPSQNPFICPRCRLHLLSTSRSTHTIRTRQASTSSTSLKYLDLSTRALLRLAGRDAGRFLHDLLPAKLLGRPPELASRPIYTVFLNAQGRVLNDVFVYPPNTPSEEETWFVEVDKDGVGELVKHLKKHKLRAKFALRELDPVEARVWSVWSDASEQKAASKIYDELQRSGVGGIDPRPTMGDRWLSTQQTETDALQKVLKEKGEQVSEHEYTVRRMLNGIAEGSKEIIPASALPMESNVEFFDGIDFHKGCYVGQELTIRTHHTGVIRKRILPCQLYFDSEPLQQNQETLQCNPRSSISLPAPGSNISKASSARGRSVGKWLGGLNNVGLALCRLEPMTGIQLTEEAGQYDPDEEFKIGVNSGPDGKATGEVKVKPFIPPWLMQSINGEKERRQRKTSRQAEEEEEEDAGS